MFTLISNGDVYAPEKLGRKDILLAAGKIALIDDHIDLGSAFKEVKRIDAGGKAVVPGFIDGHVHILGGGGEGGFRTRTPAIELSDMTGAGVTTVVGCLGTDGFGRNLVSLLAKAHALQEEGVSAYLYTGSYQLPVTTITGRVENDIMLIDKFIGVGEIAISDHRSSQPTVDELAKLAAAARIGGMLSGKAGIVNIHVGDGARKLEYLERIAETTEIPITQFYPTHINRNRELFEHGIRYAERGGYVDFTTSTIPQFLKDGKVKCSRALKQMLEQGVPPEQITFTSDGQGSLPNFNAQGEMVGYGVGTCASLFKEVRDAVRDERIDLSIALQVITSNPARILKLPNKGRLHKGLDADVVLLEPASLAIETVIAKGTVMVENGEIVKKGMFEI